MANINLLHELLMFAKTSGRKMTVKDAVEVYYDYYLEDCCHTLSVDLIPQEGKLRRVLESSALNEKQRALVYDLLEGIELAKAEEDAIVKNCVDLGYHEDEYYGDYCREDAPESTQSVWEEYIKSRESDYLLYKRFPDDCELPF